MIELLVYAGAKAVARGASVAGKSIATRQAKAQAEADAETSDWAAKALARFGSVPEEAAPASLPSQLAKASPAPRTRMRPSTIIISGPRRSPGFVGTNMKPARAPAKPVGRGPALAVAPVVADRSGPAAAFAPAPKKPAGPAFLPVSAPASRAVPQPAQAATPTRPTGTRPARLTPVPEGRATFGKRPASTG